jgi:SAM-dependent methyltransferase
MHYLMESPDETIRLDLKTDLEAVRKQAQWAGVRPGMRIADLGCGSGKTSSILFDLAQPGGTVVGVDFAEERWNFAESHYSRSGLEFRCLDIREPLDDLGSFDFVWIRFVLEYYLTDSKLLLANVMKALKPGGTLCLIDLDHNCLSHYGMNDRLNQTLFEIMEVLQQKANFDPYAGRKLYSYLFDMKIEDISMDVAAHHLIFGELKEVDNFNWLKKIEVAPQRIGYRFPAYQGSYEDFLNDYTAFFHDPRRFTYTPVISCCGRKPSA